MSSVAPDDEKLASNSSGASLPEDGAVDEVRATVAPTRWPHFIVPPVVSVGTVALFTQLENAPFVWGLGVVSGVIVGVAASVLLSGPQEYEPVAPTPETPKPEPPKAHSFVTAALKNLPAPLILLDGQGRILFANSAAEAEIGRKLVDQHYSAVLRAPGMVDAVNRAYLEKEPSRFEFSIRGASERHLQAFVQPLPKSVDSNDVLAPPRVLILLEDHTRARRAEQLHRDFVANASHELKTPLASMTASIETLRGPAKGDDAAYERFLGIMAQQAERMRALVEDLMSLNRIELNEHIAPRDAVDLSLILEDAAALAEPGAKPGQARINLAQLPPDLSLRGDARELTQVFANLMNNALKYGGDGKPIDVVPAKVAPGSSRIGISVIDRGPGIAREHLPRLTERFYRVDVPVSRNKGGTGLGLAIVKHVLNRHRGELEIDSELGRGSRFTVWLPKDDAAKGRLEPSATALLQGLREDGLRGIASSDDKE